jgi:hypothetical protein
MSTNEPIPESEIREHARDIADTLLVDAHITFVALIKERGLAGGRNGVFILDEWASALLQNAQSARESIESYRSRGLVPGDAIDDLIDAEIEAAIEARRDEIRTSDAADADDDTPPPLV